MLVWLCRLGSISLSPLPRMPPLSRSWAGPALRLPSERSDDNHYFEQASDAPQVSDRPRSRPTWTPRWGGDPREPGVRGRSCVESRADSRRLSAVTAANAGPSSLRARIEAAIAGQDAPTVTLGAGCQLGAKPLIVTDDAVVVGPVRRITTGVADQADVVRVGAALTYARAADAATVTRRKAAAVSEAARRRVGRRGRSAGITRVAFGACVRVACPARTSGIRQRAGRRAPVHRLGKHRGHVVAAFGSIIRPSVVRRVRRCAFEIRDRLASDVQAQARNPQRSSTTAWQPTVTGAWCQRSSVCSGVGASAFGMPSQSLHEMANDSATPGS